jgi:hypothetical protein
MSKPHGCRTPFQLELTVGQAERILGESTYSIAQQVAADVTYDDIRRGSIAEPIIVTQIDPCSGLVT